MRHALMSLDADPSADTHDSVLVDTDKEMLAAGHVPVGMVIDEEGAFRLAPGWRNVILVTEYDGTRYSGWQRQENAATVQGTLESALRLLCKHSITLYGSSRTDGGVHARGHVSNFRTNCRIPTDRIPIASIGLLPGDIVIRQAADAPPDFNARFHASAKTYSYSVWNSPQPSALLGRFSSHVPGPLDLGLMQKAAADLVGVYDFSAFKAEGGQTKTSVREIFSVSVEQTAWPPGGKDGLTGKPGGEGNLGLVRIIVRGSGFLYNMMRIIAGTLVYIGQGKIPADAIPDILRSCDRLRAGKTMPPEGLVLEEVEYDRWFEENVNGRHV